MVAQPSLDDIGRRARRKRDTHRALHHAALRLVADRGRDAVTTEEIAEAAGVSARTFFNYFPTKDAAILGLDPDLADRLRAHAASLPKELTPGDVAQSVASWMIADFQADADTWRLRRQAIRSHEELLQLSTQRSFRVELLLTDVFAARYDAEATGLHPQLLALVTMSVVRVAIRQQVDHTDAADPVAECFRWLASGMPGPE